MSPTNKNDKFFLKHKEVYSQRNSFYVTKKDITDENNPVTIGPIKLEDNPPSNFYISLKIISIQSNCIVKIC